MNSIDSINGMTHTEATKLRRARVRTTTTFLQIASSRSGRALLTKETGINSPKLLHWARRAELMKIKNLFFLKLFHSLIPIQQKSYQNYCSLYQLLTEVMVCP